MAKISAGSYDLNTWLHGGYERGVISVLYGGAGTGKTNFSTLAAVSQAKKGNKVIFVDTEGGLSADRVKQLVGEEKKDVMRNILLLNPTNFSEQKKVFESLNVYLKNEVSLIIVDSMTILYRLDFAEARDGKKKQDSEGVDPALQHINSILARQMRQLSEIARKREIPVLVTNQVYRWENNNKMVGGDILHYWGKCLIELVHDKGRRTAYLRKHRSLPEKSLAFQIHNSGIRKRGWI